MRGIRNRYGLGSRRYRPPNRDPGGNFLRPYSMAAGLILTAMRCMSRSWERSILAR